MACTATSSACVESRPPDTPTTRRRASLGQRAQALRERRRLDEEDLARSDGRAAPDRTGRREAGRPDGGARARRAGARASRTGRRRARRGTRRACRAAFCPKDVCRMRSVSSAARSTSAIADAPASANRSVSASSSPRSAISPWPSHARSAVDSPKPAALYSCAARFFAADMRTRSRRYSHLPTVTFDAERLASTVAPGERRERARRDGRPEVLADLRVQREPVHVRERHEDVGAEGDVVTQELDRVAARRRRRLEPARLVELAIAGRVRLGCRRRAGRPP